MKRKNIYVLCSILLLLITSCERWITDHNIGIYNSDYVVLNDLHSPVSIRLWMFGKIREEKLLASGDVFQHSLNGSEGGPSNPVLEFDSIQVMFSNNTHKTDIDCTIYHYNNRDSTNKAECEKDTITMYDNKYHEITEVGKKHYKYLYRINAKDSLEAK